MNQRDKERENQLIVEYFQTMDTYRRLNWDSLLKGVSGREVQFLKTIERFHWTHPEVPGVYVNDLAEKLGVTKSAVSKMLRHLEERGLIERRVDPDNRRNTFVCLTEEGFAMGERQRENYDAFLMRVVDSLGEARYLEILGGVRELTQCMERELERTNESKKTREET